MRWPGVAAVEVSLISIRKGTWKREYNLNGRLTGRISSHLDDSEYIGEPFRLISNKR